MITKSKIEVIQKKLKEALAQIEKEENVKIDFGSIKYTPGSYSTSMRVATLEKSDKVDKLLKSVCTSLGFTQNIIGMQFKSDQSGSFYEITDVKVKNWRYPIIAKNLSTGKLYKFPSDRVKKYFGGDAMINRNANLDKLLCK